MGESSRVVLAILALAAGPACSLLVEPSSPGADGAPDDAQDPPVDLASCRIGDQQWRRRTSIRVTNPTSELLTDFPLPVPIGPAQYTELGLQPEGADLRFVSDTAQLLPHEIEVLDPLQGGIVWVWLPSLLPGPAERTIWVLSDNAGASDRQRPADLWGTFAGVWHLADTLAEPVVRDSIGINHGTPSSPGPEAASGRIGGALRFFAGADIVSVGNGFPMVDAFTLEAWVRPESCTVTDQRPINKQGSYFLGSFQNSPELPRDHAGIVVRYQSDAWRVNASPSSPPLGEWTYLVGRLEPEGLTTRLFVDGQPPASATQVGTVFDAGGAFSLGDGLCATMDEVRVSALARSDAWIAAQYRAEAGEISEIGNTEDCP